MPSEIIENISKFAGSITEKEVDLIKEPIFKEAFSRNKILFAENKFWMYGVQKGFLGSKRRLYDKINKKMHNL